MNKFKSFILPHGDIDGRFAGYKNDFLKFSLYSMQWSVVCGAVNGSSSLMHA